MIHSNQFSDNVRIPIIPLPENLKHLRTNGEIIVDEENKKIFIVDRNDTNIIHDLTDWIITHIDSIDGNLIQITIEGMGTILLKNILNEILNKIDERTIEAVDISDFSFYYQDGDIDLKSIKPYLNKLEIAGFAEASDNTIPIKNDDEIKWVNISDLSGGNNGNPNYPGQGGSSGTTDGDSSIDLAYGNVYDIVPQNQILYLIISKRQQSRYLSGNYLVILPRSIYSYIAIEWNIITDSSYLTLTYQDNIYFNKEEFNKFKPNTRYQISFISHDKGKTWICEIKEFENKYLGGN